MKDADINSLEKNNPIGNLLMVIDARIKEIAAKKEPFTLEEMYELSAMTTAYLVNKVERYASPILKAKLSEHVKKVGHQMVSLGRGSTCGTPQEGEE